MYRKVEHFGTEAIILNFFLNLHIIHTYTSIPLKTLNYSILDLCTKKSIFYCMFLLLSVALAEMVNEGKYEIEGKVFVFLTKINLGICGK